MLAAKQPASFEIVNYQEIAATLMHHRCLMSSAKLLGQVNAPKLTMQDDRLNIFLKIYPPTQSFDLLP
jgi:hypothetical protein